MSTDPLRRLNNAGDTDPVSPNHVATSAGNDIMVESVIAVESCVPYRCAALNADVEITIDLNLATE